MLARAWVRGFALINAADSHPLIVPRIRKYLADVLKVDKAGRTAWLQHWLGAGLHAMEELLAEKNPTCKFCRGDSPTIADICLVTQVTPAQLFNTSVEPFKRVMRIYDACMAIPAFADAHPRKQPDFDGHWFRHTAFGSGPIYTPCPNDRIRPPYTTVRVTRPSFIDKMFSHDPTRTRKIDPYFLDASGDLCCSGSD
jgi:hypothetical protein